MACDCGMTSKESIGERIKRLRLGQGMSQGELTDGLPRVSYAFVSRIESGPT
jgi:hypothetical protein